jgi:hypothetical protein
MALQHFVEPWPLLSFVLLYTVGRTLGGGISPSQSRYLHIGQHKDRINACADIYALSGIRTNDSRFERAKTVLALDRAATVIGFKSV